MVTATIHELGRHKILLLITLVSSQGSGRPVHTRSLARAFACHIH